MQVSYRIYTILSVPKVGQKIQMEGVQLILMNAAPRLAKVPQTGAPLIHLSGASIHLEVFGVDPALKDTQVSTLSFLPQIHKKNLFLFRKCKIYTSFTIFGMIFHQVLQVHRYVFFNFLTFYSVLWFFSIFASTELTFWSKQFTFDSLYICKILQAIILTGLKV